MTNTTITLDTAVKKRLARMKVHPRESYSAVLRRLLKAARASNSSVDVEAILETLDIVSDPETMRDIAKGIEDVKAGRLYSIDEV